MESLYDFIVKLYNKEVLFIINTPLKNMRINKTIGLMVAMTTALISHYADNDQIPIQSNLRLSNHL